MRNGGDMGPVTQRIDVEKIVKDKMLNQFFPPELLQKVLDNKSNINNISFSEGKVAFQFTTTTARDNFAKSISEEYKAKKEYSYGLVFNVDALTSMYSKLAEVSSDISSLSKEKTGDFEFQSKLEMTEVQKSTESIKEDNQMEKLVAEMEKESISKEKKGWWARYKEDLMSLKDILDAIKYYKEKDVLEERAKLVEIMQKLSKMHQETKKRLEYETGENREQIKLLEKRQAEILSKLEQMEKEKQKSTKVTKQKTKSAAEEQKQESQKQVSSEHKQLSIDEIKAALDKSPPKLTLAYGDLQPAALESLQNSKKVITNSKKENYMIRFEDSSKTVRFTKAK